MTRRLNVIRASALALAIQSCSSTEKIRFEDMTEYDLTRSNLGQSAADQVVCFGPSRGFANGRFQKVKRECFTTREIEIYTILPSRSPHDMGTTGGFETDKGDF